MEMLNRLKQLHDDNPDLQELLEEKFPELEDKSPYIMVNQLFMRKGRDTSLYQLVSTGNKGVIIKNVTDNAYWSNAVNVSNPNAYSKKEFYLTKARFTSMLKKSSIKLESLRLLKEYDLTVLYRLKWED